jgi:integrase
MSVKVRPYRTGGWEVDIRVALPDRTVIRERRKAPTRSESGARRWGLAREKEILLHGPAKPRKEVPTLTEFYPRFLEGYARANRLKPSAIVAKESICRVHLGPMLGAKRLDAITNEDVQRLKAHLSDRAPKTVNNVLSVLSRMLKVAVEWNILDGMPCQMRLLRVPQTQAEFYDFEDYSRLVEAAQAIHAQAHLVVLLGGDAGLRCGEMLALEWPDVDLRRRQLRIQRSDWRGNVTATKSGRPRAVPVTARLEKALRGHKHLRGPRVLCHEDGSPLTHTSLRNLTQRAARKAGLAKHGLHLLRHTFCSHLSMRGAPARAIQELAGHQELSTTQRYMHLSPAAIESAIRLLEEPSPVSKFGEIVETAPGENAKSKR